MVASVFLTHAEPVVDPRTPIESWGLAAVGVARAGAWRAPTDRVVTSTEQKAVDTARLVAGPEPVVPIALDERLVEIDRSATGYLPFDEFDAVVDAFFARPTVSVRGWERAVDAQERIVDAVRAHAATGDVTIVSHGAVGALLLASLSGAPISRAFEQPGMGSVLTFDAVRWRATDAWRRLPLPPEHV